MARCSSSVTRPRIRIWRCRAVGMSCCARSITWHGAAAAVSVPARSGGGCWHSWPGWERSPRVDGARCRSRRRRWASGWRRWPRPSVARPNTRSIGRAYARRHSQLRSAARFRRGRPSSIARMAVATTCARGSIPVSAACCSI